MKNQVLRKLLLLVTVGLTLSLNSCVKENIGAYDPNLTTERADIILRLETPGSFAAPTRTLSVADESKISNVYILAFKGTGNDITLSYIVKGEAPVLISANTFEFKANIPASVNTPGDTSRLVVIANAETAITTLFGANLQDYTISVH